ncbi:hypothetical protein VTI74DRAFT_9439 [Chaetomium olivicolor]
MGAVNTSSAQQMARSSASASPDPSNVDEQLVAGMSALKSHDGDSQQSYVPSHWSGSDDFDNYPLHDSPALSSLQHGSSSQSSPCSWDSPEQLGPTPWEAATEQHEISPRYSGLDPQLTGYPPLRDSYSSIPTSFPADVPFVPSHYNGSKSGFQHARSQTEPYPARYHAGSRDYPSTPESSHPLSPCSTTLGLPMDEGIPSTPADGLSNLAPESGPEAQSRRKSPPVSEQNDGKGGEPYAKLIYRAFLSTPRRAMTLQEIYQWFRENTNKGKGASKGWQNSIRHNLSMNGAFNKRERKFSTSKDGGTGNSSRSDSGKKSTEWFLEPWAAAGVESTTRYRKGNQSRRSATSHRCRTSRSWPSSHHHNHHYCSSRRRSASASGILSGRMHRGTRRAPLHSPAGSASSAPASPGMQYHHFSLSPLHHHGLHASHASHAPFIHNLMNDASSTTSSPYTPHFFHSPGQPTPGMDSTGRGAMDYGHCPTDPALFPSPVTHVLAAPTAGSQSAVGGGDEPTVTPEPHHHHHTASGFGSGGDAATGLMLPDLRTTSPSAGYLHHGEGLQYPPMQAHHHHPVEVYDEVEVERYSHHQGWGPALNGMEESGYDGHHDAQGYC